MAVERDERPILLGFLRFRLPAGSSDGLWIECACRKALVAELLCLVEVRLMSAHRCDRLSMDGSCSLVEAYIDWNAGSY